MYTTEHFRILDFLCVLFSHVRIIKPTFYVFEVIKIKSVEGTMPNP